MALDFISLLLSKDAPRQAELTMSPYLKQHIKPGTLGLDVWNGMQPDKEELQADDALARGRKMQSLQASADSLLGAAARLEKDVRRETRYWEQVLSVSESGWSICRMPNERHNLGVRFGFLESREPYFRRGLAALRADGSGNVVLDKGLRENSKSVRIRMQQGSKVVSVSKSPPTMLESEDSLKNRIRAARDTLYEEELFQEIIEESRTLASYGVEMNRSTIRIPTRLNAGAFDTTALAADAILVDLVNLDVADDDDVGEASPHNPSAHSIALAFRLLLSYAHRRRLRQRSRVPQPMSLAKQDAPVAHILRPVIALLQHQLLSSDVDSYLGRIKALLGKAGIECMVQPAKLDGTILGQAAGMDSLMDNLLKPLHSQASLSLHIPERTESLDYTLEIDTASSAPTLSSKMLVLSPVGLRAVELSDMDDLTEHFSAAMARALCQGIADTQAGWSVNERTGNLFKQDNSDRLVMEIQCAESGGGAEADKIVLTTRGSTIEWTQSGEGQGQQERRQFWDVVKGSQ